MEENKIINKKPLVLISTRHLKRYNLAEDVCRELRKYCACPPPQAEFQFYLKSLKSLDENSAK